MRRRPALETDIDGLERLSRDQLRTRWTKELAEKPPASIGHGILALGIAYARQERCHGGISGRVARELDRAPRSDLTNGTSVPSPVLRSGTILVREWQGITHHVTAVDDGFVWNGQTHRSLSSIARAITGTKWNGPRFFGLRETNTNAAASSKGG